MLPCVCSVMDHRRRQNVVRTSVTHSAIASRATFLFLPHFDVICDLLLNRRTATWNLFLNWTTLYASCSPQFVTQCNGQSGTPILENKPIILRESYRQRLLFLCVMILDCSLVWSRSEIKTFFGVEYCGKKQIESG